MYIGRSHFCRPYWSLLGVALVAAWFNPAAGQAKDEASANTLFEQLDTNHDQAISATEVPADKLPLFERLLRRGDTDQNGQLSRQELASSLEASVAGQDRTGRVATNRSGHAKPGQILARLDTNHDGRLTADEIPADQKQRFERWVRRADADADGAVSRAELIAWVQQHAAARAPSSADAAGDTNAAAKSVAPQTADSPSVPLGRSPGQRAMTPERIERRLLRHDANHDGRLERTEVVEQRARQFDRFDANHDGVLDQAEIQALARQIAAHVGHHPKRKKPANV